MNNKALERVCRNEKGSSLIFSLIIILILVAFSMAVLTMSVGNLKLSANSQKSNQGTSLQERIGQYYVTEIEKALKASEDDAQTYIRKSLFTLAGPEAKVLQDSSVSNELKAFLSSGNQVYYNALWLTKVQAPSTIPKVSHSGTGEDRINNYLSSKLFEPYFEEVFPYVYKYCAVKRLSNLSSEIKTGRHNEALANFVGDQSTFNSHYSLSEFTMPELDLTFGKDNLNVLNQYDQNLMNRTDISKVQAGFNEATINFNIQTDNQRKLYAAVKIITPTTESITQASNRTIYGNPIWANALTTKGVVTVSEGSNVVVQGDLFSAGMNQEKESIVVNNANLKIYGNLNARGNVVLKQTDNDLRMKSIEISPYPNNLSTLDKRKLYDNSPYYLKIQNRQAFGYDSKAGNELYRKGIGALIQTESKLDDQSKETSLPYVLNDNEGGNVYARGLLIDSRVKGGRIIVNGDTTFFDDVVNKAGSASKIDLNGYVMGLDQLGLDISTFGNEVKDHFSMEQSDDGSCIKNFNATAGNQINIVSPMVFVPGNAIVSDIGGAKYKTGAGVIDFSFNEDYLKPYLFLENIGSSDSHVNFSDRQKAFRLTATKSLMLGEAEATKKTYIENNKDNHYLARNVVKSGISIQLTSQEKKSFINGTSIFKVDQEDNARIGSNYMNVLQADNTETNYFNTYKPLVDEYSRVLGSDESMTDQTMKKMYVYEYIYRVFKSKTQYLGLWGIDDMMKLVNKEVIKDSESSTGAFMPYNKIKFMALKSPQNGTIDFDLATIKENTKADSFSGVIFADGDLNLSASKNIEFKGMIICSGNVTLNGNFKLIYDETVMKKVLMESELATEFFQPGETGMQLYTKNRETSSARGKKVKAGERLEIVKWKLSK